MKLQKLFIILFLTSFNSLIAMQPTQWIRTAKQEIEKEKKDKSTKLLILLKTGPQVDVEDESLRDALILSWIKKIQQTLTNGADPNTLDSNDYSPLIYAIKLGYIPVIESLLEAGANPNLKATKDKVTPLIYAVEQGYLYILKLLLGWNADPNIADDKKRTPLLIVALRGRLEAMRALLDAGANPNIYSKWAEFTPLNMLATNGNIEGVKILLAHGASGNIPDNSENTPLINAIRFAPAYTLPELVELLLAAGADPLRKNKKGKNAIDIAREKRLEKIIKLLAAHGKT